MKSLRYAAVILAAAACSSPAPEGGAAPVDAAGLESAALSEDAAPNDATDPCVCGETDLDGCFCSLCAEADGNPDNPLCTCMPLTVATPSDNGLGNTRTVGVGGESFKPAPQVLLDKSGKRVRGIVTEDDGQRITVRFQLPDGTQGEQSLRYEQLDPRTVYRLRLGRTPLDDGAAQFALAEFAGSIGLYDSALRHLLQAAEADTALAPKVETRIAELRESAALAQVEVAHTAVRRGDLAAAEQALNSAMAEFSDTEAVVEAETLLLEVGRRIQEEQQERAARSAATAEKRLQPAIGRYEKAIEHMAGGMAIPSTRTTAAIRAFERAEAEFENTRRRVHNLGKRRDADDAFLALCDDLLAQVNPDYYRNELQLAGRHLQRGSFNNARRAIDKILAEVPDHKEALALLQRVRDAEQYEDEDDLDDRWWRRRWRLGGWGRRPWVRSGWGVGGGVYLGGGRRRR